MDFSSFTQIQINLFIFNPLMRRHTAMSFKALGFENVIDSEVPRNYYQALAKLTPIIAGEAELVLLNLPPKPRPGAKNDVKAIYDEINELYTDIKAGLAHRSGDPFEYLSKTIPLIEVGDYLREKLVEVLFKYRVPAAFFMSVPESTRGLKGKRLEEKARENFQLYFHEIATYMAQYFRDKEDLVALADEKKSESELSERKKKYEALMADANRLKGEGNYEAAINVLRQAISVFPKDIEAYLESGRLHVRRKEYGRALSRFAQAEDLFRDAPAPNKEIANVRLIQAKEKIEFGADPNSPEIMELLKEALNQYRTAHAKTVEMTDKAPESPNLGHQMIIGQEILKWELTDFLGPKHPVVKEMYALAAETTKGLGDLPLDRLSAMQCLSLALQAVEKGDINQAQKYYFQALKDKNNFSEVCTEINLFGIRLRKLGQIDEAIRVYNRLIKYKPPNLGSIFWNMAIAFASRNETLNAAGFAARCLYTDPFLARETQFYNSMTPQLTPIIYRLIRVLKLIVRNRELVKPSAQLVKLYSIHARLIRLITSKKREQALKLWLMLFRQARKFTLKPEFYGSGTVPDFLRFTREILGKNDSPSNRATAQVIDQYLKFVAGHPAEPRLARHIKLTQAAVMTMEESGDQPRAIYYLGQSILVIPETYFKKPDFYAQENLPAMVHELFGKLKYIDSEKLPSAAPIGSARKKKPPKA